MKLLPVRASLAAALCLVSSIAIAQLPQPDGGNIERGTLPDHWYSQMPKCMEIPEWQVHEYNKDFYILRQSPCTDFEKPFIFLIFGKDKALLMDTRLAQRQPRARRCSAPSRTGLSATTGPAFR